MNTKIILSGLVAATALVGVAIAQTPPTASGAPAGSPTERQGRGPRMDAMSRDDMQAMVDARLAGAKAALKLTPEQERLWSPVDQAARTMATERMNRAEQHRAMREQRRQGNNAQRPDFMAQMERMTEFSSKNAENLKAATAAMKPLWATLDDRQKRILPRLLRPAGKEARGGGEHHGRWSYGGSAHGHMGQGWHRGPGAEGAPERGTPPAPR
jgi:zinc resistance-associated protein